MHEMTAAGPPVPWSHEEKLYLPWCASRGTHPSSGGPSTPGKSISRMNLKRLHPVPRTGFLSETIALEMPCRPEPAVLPPLRPWSRNAATRCAFGDVTAFWTDHDAVSFLVDLGAYHPSLHAHLSSGERERERRFTTAVSRRRFVVSRCILKRVLVEILPEERIAGIVLAQNAGGRICVEGRPDVYVSLSYSGRSIAIAVGKRKLGSDLEGVRPVRDAKITASPAYRSYPPPRDADRSQQVIHVWTLLESYAKLFDQNPYPLLDRCAPFPGAEFVSYCIDRRAILSLASAPGRLDDALVWLDPGGAEHSRAPG